MLIDNGLSRNVKCSTFSTSSGTGEFYFTATAKEGGSFKDAIEELTGYYTATIFENGLDESTVQFTRFYLSDIVNDFNELKQSDLLKMVSNGAVSFIQQSPLIGGQLAMLVYHIKAPENIVSDSYKIDNCCQKKYTQGKNYSLLWTASATNNSHNDSAMQTLKIFSDLSSDLRQHGLNIRDNTVRTWIYVRDVDNNYAGMVNARRELFNIIDLTKETRYIASTGIEGCPVDPHCLVSMDSLSIGNLKEEQIVRMEALENLSSTIVYGVTFERGLRIRFGDRSHLYISGTASIDSAGNIMYESDICGQTERTVENVKALLTPHGAMLSDMQYLIIYLRNAKHFLIIKELLNKLIPENVPVIPVEGPVCRPGWLIEMEGVAIIPDNTKYPPFI